MEPFGFKSARLSYPMGGGRVGGGGGGGRRSRPKKWSLRDMDLEQQGSMKGGGGRRHSNMSIESSSFGNRDMEDHLDYDPIDDVANARAMAKSKRKISLWTLFRYANWFDILLMFLGGTIALFSGIIIPWIFLWYGKLLLVLIWDAKCENHPHNMKRLKEEVWLFTINVCIGGAALFVSHYVSWRAFAWSADLQMKRMASKYFEWILRKDLAWFDIYVDKEFSNLMNEELTQVRVGIGENIPALINQISTELCIIALTIILHYKLALFLFSMGPLFYLLTFLVSYAEQHQREDSAKAFTRGGRMAEDVLCSIKMIKVFQGERTEIKRFTKYLQFTSKRQFHWILVASICTGVIWLCIYSEMAGAIVISTSTIVIPKDFCKSINATIGVTEYHFDMEELFHPLGPQSYAVVLMALAIVGSHSLDIPFYIMRLVEAKRRAAEIFFLIDWKPRIDNMSKDGNTPRGFAIGKIEFAKVGFRYPRSPDDWAIKSTTLVIYPTQIIGIFGREHSGKSTVLKLIMRLYDPCEGLITIDGVDIQHYNIMWLRSQICFISHETLVFPVSIAENLRFIRADCSMADMEEACKIAEIHDRIMQLPKGYSTIMIGGNQCNIFNFQELVKISIARALLMRPKILLVGEKPISSDENLENVVLKMIHKLRRSSTVIIAASRANAIMKHCDHIFYFENGEIVDHGTHLELLHERGPYYKMVEATLDTVTDVRTKLTSQLGAYKFAKALRRANERKRQNRENKVVHRKESILAEKDEMLNIMLHPLSEHERKQFYYTGFGFGGFQKYSFAKSAEFNPARIFKLFNKLHSKRVAATLKKKKKTSDSQAALMKPKVHQPITPVADVSYMQEFSEGSIKPANNSSLVRKALKSSLKGRDSSGIEVPREHVRISDMIVRSDSLPRAGIHSTIKQSTVSLHDLEDDNVSVSSEDSDEFWEEYSEKMECLRHGKHESGSWCQILKLANINGNISVWIILGALSSVALGFGAPVSDYLIVETCLTFTKHDDGPRGRRIVELAVTFVILGLICGLAAFGQEFCFSIAGRNVCTKLRTSLFAAMLQQDLDWFDKTENDISVLCARLASDVDTIQHVLMTTLGVTLQNFTSLVVSITAVIILFDGYQRQIVLVVSGTTIFMIMLSYLSGILFFNHLSVMESLLENSSEFSYHTISNVKTCVILGLEKYFMTQFNQALDKPFRIFFLLSELRCIINAAARALPWIIAALFVYSSFHFSPEDKPPTIEYLFLVMGMTILRARGIGETLSLLTKSSMGKIAAFRINGILKNQPLVISKSGAVKKEFDETPSIELQNVCFRYNTAEPNILNGIDLTIPPNSYIAIIGSKDSGKATLANLILRLILPKEGKILINGEDIENIDMESFRKIVAFVENDPCILHDMSVAENIKFGNGSTTQDVIEEAAKAAKVHYDILSLKHGYETKLDSHSAIFSHSLRQKLSLARALAKSPKILVVGNIQVSDDTDHEVSMKTAIRDYCGHGRTVILFSQNVAPIRQVDMIYLLNDGVILESGNHSALLDQQGEYFSLYMTQRMLVSAAELNVDQGATELESETIETLKRHATAHAKRKSSVAYTKFLAMEMERMRDQLKQRGEAMKEEEEVAKMVKKLHFDEDDDGKDKPNNDKPKDNKKDPPKSDKK